MGPLDIGYWGPQVQVQKGQQNKNAEQKQRNKNSGKKLVGTIGHWDGDPKKCKKVRGTKTLEQKQGIGHWVMGTLSTSAKRSAEQMQKSSGTKRVEQKQRNKNWWGPLDIG